MTPEQLYWLATTLFAVSIVLALVAHFTERSAAHDRSVAEAKLKHADNVCAKAQQLLDQFKQGQRMLAELRRLEEAPPDRTLHWVATADENGPVGHWMTTECSAECPFRGMPGPCVCEGT